MTDGKITLEQAQADYAAANARRSMKWSIGQMAAMESAFESLGDTAGAVMFESVLHAWAIVGGHGCADTHRKGADQAMGRAFAFLADDPEKTERLRELVCRFRELKIEYDRASHAHAEALKKLIEIPAMLLVAPTPPEGMAN